MSLLGSTKFWNTRMRLRTRLSYLSGFCYYLHTALFTFVGPLVPIVLLAWFPQSVAPANYLWIVPSLIYNLVVFPLWHRCAYRVEAWTVKMVYGWAHAFAIWDLLRGQSMGWQPTGGTGRKNRTGRLWWGIGRLHRGQWRTVDRPGGAPDDRRRPVDLRARLPRGRVLPGRRVAGAAGEAGAGHPAGAFPVTSGNCSPS